MEYKKGMHYTAATLKRGWGDGTFFLIFFLLASLIYYIYQGYGTYLLEQEEKTQLWEPYIWFMGGAGGRVSYLIVSVCLGYQSVRSSYGDYFSLIRMDRKQWIISRILHLVSMVIFVNLLILIVSVLACRGQVTVENQWSPLLMQGAQYGVKALGIKRVVSISYYVSGYSPWIVGMATAGLSVLEGIAIGSMILCAELLGVVTWGAAAVIMLYYVSYLDSYSVFGKNLFIVNPFYLSDIYDTSLNTGWVPIGTAFLYLGIYCLILIGAGVCLSKKSDLSDP